MHLTAITFDFTMSIPQIIKREEYLARLIGALTKFTKDHSMASPGDFDDGFDEAREFSLQLSETLSPEIRDLVYEVQIHLLCGMTHAGRIMTARGLCEQALQDYGDEYPLRRVRVMERYLYLAVVAGDHPEKYIEMALTAVLPLTSKKVHFYTWIGGAYGRRLGRMRAWSGLGNSFLRAFLLGWGFSRILRTSQRWSTFHRPCQSGHGGSKKFSRSPKKKIKTRCSKSPRFSVLNPLGSRF